jgi:hypothetical protein
MFNFFTKDDAHIQSDVKKEFESDPSITAGQITVTVEKGIVTLTGHVPFFSQKTSAEEAAQRVAGVRAVADEIDVKLMGSYEKSDAEIANAVSDVIRWSNRFHLGDKL